MNKFSFNTGRLYCQNGQPIVAAEVDGKVYFADRARLISGWLKATCRDITPKRLMAAYDAGEYSIFPPDEMSNEEARRIEDEAGLMLSAPLCSALKI